jgi:hypothetical protein
MWENHSGRPAGSLLQSRRAGLAGTDNRGALSPYTPARRPGWQIKRN